MTRRHDLRIILRTIELLDRPYGWVKGKMRENNRGVQAYCMVGALRQAAKEGGYSQRSYERAMNLVKAEVAPNRLGTPSAAIIYFNDRRSTKKSQVLEVLKKASQV
jgi:hypothetical protein